MLKNVLCLTAIATCQSEMRLAPTLSCRRINSFIVFMFTQNNDKQLSTFSLSYDVRCLFHLYLSELIYKTSYHFSFSSCPSAFTKKTQAKCLKTRCSAVARGPRGAVCQLKSYINLLDNCTKNHMCKRQITCTLYLKGRYSRGYKTFEYRPESILEHVAYRG